MKRSLPFLLLVSALPFFSCSKKEAPTIEKPELAAVAQPEKAAVATPAVPAGNSPAAAVTVAAQPLKIAYSDWPGWVAWEIAIQKGWFKEAGVEVEFSWFEYVPSMEAYSAGKVDAVAVTNGDALVTGSGGAASIAILLNDYSDGNDMIVAKPGIEKVSQLKGKKIGVEVGFVDHLLLLKALESAKLTEKDVQITNIKTDEAAQALKSGSYDAVAAWQPNSGQALKLVPGSKAIYTSADIPGLIYDVLAVSPRSLAERRSDWLKVTKTWFRIADYLANPANLDDAAKVMSARVGLTPAEYRQLMGGTHFLGIKDNLKHFQKRQSLDSVYYSSQIVDKFQVDNQVYKQAMKTEDYLDPSLVLELSKASSTTVEASAAQK